MFGRYSREAIAEYLKRAAWIFFVIIIGYLLIASIFSTCYLGAYSYGTASGATEVNVEHTFYIRDHFLWHMIVFAGFSLFLVFGRTEKAKQVVSGRYFGAAVCLAAGILSVLLVLAGQYYPKYDQRNVIEAAARLNQHIYSDFEEGGYLFVFPFQTGVVLYFRILCFLFGNENQVAFQIVNCLWIALAYYFFVRIAELLWGERASCRSWTAVACILFFPYLLYASFLYGTVAGMAFALFSFYMLLLYEKTPKVWYLLCSALSMGIAMVIKSNYMIFMIAALIYLFLKLLQEKEAGFRRALPRLLLAGMFLGVFLLGRLGVDAYITKAAGEEIEGIPMTAWIAMGLQDGKAAPGWYNGYNNRVYVENDYDYGETSAAVTEEIKRIVRGWTKDPAASISFFVKKVSSQWNNPTFQSLWILEERPGRGGLDWLLSGAGRYGYIFFVNLLQTWILAGVFAYAVLRFKKSSMEEIILPVTFLGGFLFHLFWEAEGLYAILYFPLLLPLAVRGYGEWRAYLLAKKERIAADGWNSGEGKRFKRNLIRCALAVVFVCAVSYTDPFAKLFARNENTGAFDIYTQEVVNEMEALP